MTEMGDEGERVCVYSFWGSFFDVLSLCLVGIQAVVAYCLQITIHVLISCCFQSHPNLEVSPGIAVWCVQPARMQSEFDI